MQEDERYQVLQYDLRNSGSYKRDFMSRTLCVRKLRMSLLIMIAELPRARSARAAEHHG